METTAYSHKDVTILFTDAVTANEVMVYLDALFTGLDALLDVHGVQKVETAGDCYIVAAGILTQR